MARKIWQATKMNRERVSTTPDTNEALAASVDDSESEGDSVSTKQRTIRLAIFDLHCGVQTEGIQSE